MTTILVLWVCLHSGQGCQHIVGETMEWYSCVGIQGQAKAADWINQNPKYRLKRWQCVEPVRLLAILGRNQA